jgi:SAM-dependent methyltransferase
MEAAQQQRGVDLLDLNNASSIAALSVPEGSRVLDLGCGDGTAARLLSGRDCRVIGVERNESAAALARRYCERVLVADIEDAGTHALLAGEAFDAVLMLDLLGFLRDPRAVIAAARQWLRPEGRLIVSVRNVAHGAVRLSLLAGTFPGSDESVGQERSRLFDARSVEGLLQAAGFQVAQRLRVTRSLEETDVPFDAAACTDAVVERLRHDHDALTYELVFVASPDGAAARAPAGELSEHLQRRVHDIESAGRALTARAARAEADAASHAAAAREMETLASRASQRVTELETELARRMEELHLRHQEVRQLQSDVALREGFITQVRAQADGDRTTMTAVRGELQRARADVVGLSTRLTEAQGVIADLTAEATRAHAEVARLNAVPRDSHDDGREAAALRAELQRHQAALGELRAYAGSPGFRLVDRVSLRLRRHPRLYRALQGTLRKVAGRSNGSHD